MKWNETVCSQLGLYLGTSQATEACLLLFFNHFLHFSWRMARSKVMQENSITIWEVLLHSLNNSALYNITVFFWINHSFNWNKATRPCKGKTFPKHLFWRMFYCLLKMSSCQRFCLAPPYNSFSVTLDKVNTTFCYHH